MNGRERQVKSQPGREKLQERLAKLSLNEQLERMRRRLASS